MSRSAWSTRRIRSSVRSYWMPSKAASRRSGGFAGGAGSFGHVRKIDVCRHAGAQLIFGVIEPHFYAKNLPDSIFEGLHISRREFGLPINLFNRAVEILVAKRVDSDPDLIIQLDVTQPCFGNINADPKMLRQEKRRDFSIGGGHGGHLSAQDLPDANRPRATTHPLEFQ